MGTGTGRVLEVFAPSVGRATGVDLSREMLAVARSNLERAGFENCGVRHADMYSLPFSESVMDAVVFHQVLHFAEDPAGAVAEGARVLAPGGRLVVVDFAPHEVETLRGDHAHRRLGFADVEVTGWCEAAGLGIAAIQHLPGDPLTVTLWAAEWPRKTQGLVAAMDSTIPIHGNAAGIGGKDKVPQVSFEFFPPNTPEMEDILWRSVRRLAPLGPKFVSVTYGAGGSTRERTHDIVTKVMRDSAIAAAAHLTCVAASRAEVDAVAQSYWDAGIRHVVALRGDPPAGVDKFEAHPDGYANAVELIAGLKRIGDFDISAAAYPEVHPEAESAASDLDFLKRKIDNGANRAITQFFFDASVFLRFAERARAAGITVPIVPGIMPVSNFKGVKRFADRCGASIPDWLGGLFEGLDKDPETRKLVGATVAAEQCRLLQAAGVNQFHFYTLNRADLTFAICHILGLRPKAGHDRASQ